MAGDLLVLDDIRAGNGRVDLKARLRIDDGVPAGDLYARWGVLGIGAELQGGTRRLHALGARRWYDARAGPAATALGAALRLHARPALPRVGAALWSTVAAGPWCRRVGAALWL